MIIKSRSEGRVCGSGAHASWSGVEGSFEIYEKSVNATCGNIELYNVHFDVPFIGDNKFDVVTVKESERWEAYEIKVSRGNMSANKLPLVALHISDSEQEKLRIQQAIEDQSIDAQMQF